MFSMSIDREFFLHMLLEKTEITIFRIKRPYSILKSGCSQTSWAYTRQWADL